MNRNEFLTVAAWQGPIREGDFQANLNKVLEVARYADQCQVDILCFPETYLHGYFNSYELAKQNAIDLRSEAFRQICEQFAGLKNTTVLVGLNELEDDRVYNTVAVIEKGRCLGWYRKAYTYKPYDYYSVGRDFPVFEKKGVRYGIIICLDSVYREPAHIAALKGARILFCPSFNRVQHDVHLFHYLHRKGHVITRAFDNHCWVVVSDIVWDKDKEVSAGYACVVDADGEVVARAQPFEEMLLTYAIPMRLLHEEKKTRLFGNQELSELMGDAYQQAVNDEE